MTFITDNKQKIMALYSGLIFDALHQDIKLDHPFVLDNKIHLLHGKKLFGPAFTCLGKKVEQESEIQDETRIKMLKSMTPGCIKVIANGSDTVAISGDITSMLDYKFGATGVILDGFIRDLDCIDDFLPDFPIFGRGTSPIDAYGKWQITEYQTKIFLPGITGSVPIEPGDYIFADTSGSLVIPKDLIRETLQYSFERLKAEDHIRSRIWNEDDVIKIYDEEARW